MSTSAPTPQAVAGNKYPDQMPSYRIDSSVMLTASLCLMLIVLIICVLHVYARYLISRQRQRRHDGTAGIHQQHRNAGLDPSALASLPTFVYQKGGGVAHHQKEAAVDVKECVICLGAIEDGEVVRLLPNCEHFLHVACVDKWLQFNSTCPVCRTAAVPVKIADGDNPGVVIVVDATGRTAGAPEAVAQPSAEYRNKDADDGAMGGTEEVGTSTSALASSFRKSTSTQWSRKRAADDAGALEDIESRRS